MNSLALGLDGSSHRPNHLTIRAKGNEQNEARPRHLTASNGIFTRSFLRVVLRPTVGEVILGETHGHSLPTVASNLRKTLEALDHTLDLNLAPGAETIHGHLPPTVTSILGFIRRLDDIADVGTVIGERTANLTHNLMEYHLSLVRELGGRIDSESMARLLKRFTLKQGFRASRLVEPSGLRKVLLPISPW